MQSGIVVYLCFPAAILARRILADGAENRPLLQGVELTERCAAPHHQPWFQARVCCVLDSVRWADVE
jgi:hypothetical protein